MEASRDRWMDRDLDGWTGRSMDGDCRTGNGGTDRSTDKQTDRDRLMNGQTHQWMERHIQLVDRQIDGCMEVREINGWVDTYRGIHVYCRTFSLLRCLWIGTKLLLLLLYSSSTHCITTASAAYTHLHNTNKPCWHGLVRFGTVIKLPCKR